MLGVQEVYPLVVEDQAPWESECGGGSPLLVDIISGQDGFDQE